MTPKTLEELGDAIYDLCQKYAETHGMDEDRTYVMSFSASPREDDADSSVARHWSKLCLNNSGMMIDALGCVARISAFGGFMGRKIADDAMQRAKNGIGPDAVESSVNFIFHDTCAAYMDRLEDGENGLLGEDDGNFTLVHRVIREPKKEEGGGS